VFPPLAQHEPVLEPTSLGGVERPQEGFSVHVVRFLVPTDLADDLLADEVQEVGIQVLRVTPQNVLEDLEFVGAVEFELPVGER
jgi:hypothetical protein